METITPMQQEVINGSLLGDGTIWKTFTTVQNCRFEKPQSKLDYRGFDKKSYMDWHVLALSPWNCSVHEGEYEGQGVVEERNYQRYVMTTECLPIFNDLEEKWYVPRDDHPWYKRRKIVPQDLRLTALSACIWFMDDGCNNSFDGNIELNTQGFTVDEVGFLIERLRVDLGIKSSLKVDRDNWKIYIGRKNYFKFIEMIRPFVMWDCFRYKTDTTLYTKLPNRGGTSSNSVLNEVQVDQIRAALREGKQQKEVAESFHISKTLVSMIANGNRWAHSHDGKTATTRKKTKHLTAVQIAEVIRRCSEGELQREVAKLFQVEQGTISRVLKNNSNNFTI